MFKKMLFLLCMLWSKRCSASSDPSPHIPIERQGSLSTDSTWKDCSEGPSFALLEDGPVRLGPLLSACLLTLSVLGIFSFLLAHINGSPTARYVVMQSLRDYQRSSIGLGAVIAVSPAAVEAPPAAEFPPVLPSYLFLHYNADTSSEIAGGGKNTRPAARHQMVPAVLVTPMVLEDVLEADQRITGASMDSASYAHIVTLNPHGRLGHCPIALGLIASYSPNGLTSFRAKYETALDTSAQVTPPRFGHTLGSADSRDRAGRAAFFLSSQIGPCHDLQTMERSVHPSRFANESAYTFTGHRH
jgi:hypothetical protein